MHASYVKLCLFLGAVICAFGPIARAQSLDQQERCAQQAKQAYAELNAESLAEMQKMRTHMERMWGDYQSHYNLKLGKCIMLVTKTDMTGSEFTNTAYLVDANERRLYGIYVWISKEGNKYWEVAPISCELVPSLREKRSCKTREEFDEFAASYMEE